jgi:gamma-glutamylcyclotransferase (GGCT)/AIG2-like uncharacterized protein YtfP
MKVFVYGTLKRGKGNNYLLGDSPLIGTATTKEGFVLFNCGFPKAVDFTKDALSHPLLPVKGEVYDVDDRTLRRLDSLEGHPDWYCRRYVPVQVGDEEQEAMMYVMPQYQTAPLSSIVNSVYCWTG